MKEIKSFFVGSRVFFNSIEDFSSKDEDKLYIMEDWKSKGNILVARIGTKDRIFMKNMTKDEYISNMLNGTQPIQVGKFIVPEFINYISLTIDELKTLAPVFDKLDDKHSYEKVIFESYLENNDFILTDEQRKKAYEVYKSARQNAK